MEKRLKYEGKEFDMIGYSMWGDKVFWISLFITVFVLCGIIILFRTLMGAP